jgi:AcrR family transcriptional regulator
VTAGRKDPKKSRGRTVNAGAAGRKTGGRPPAPVPENVPGNREKILTTALRLFTQYGVDATPTARISKEAGVSTGTLFYYFPDKDVLVDQLYLSIKKEMAGSVRSHDDTTLPVRERIGQCMRGYIAWGTANPFKVRFLDQFYNYPGIGEDVQKQAFDEFSWMADLIASAVREGILPDLPCEFHAMMIYRITSGILTLIESGTTGMTADEITGHGLAMFWNR